MLKILGKQLCNAVNFGIGPKMRIEPRQAIGGSAAQRCSQHGVVRIDDRKLRYEFLGLAPRVGDIEQLVFRAAPGRRRDELYDRLMWNTRTLGRDAIAKNVCRNPLLVREPVIVAIRLIRWYQSARERPCS